MVQKARFALVSGNEQRDEEKEVVDLQRAEGSEVALGGAAKSLEDRSQQGG